MPALKLSPELAELLGQEALARTQVTKEIWAYIKSNNLQDPNNKRLIVPDKALAKVFGSSEPIDMFKMTSVLSKHIIKE